MNVGAVWNPDRGYITGKVLGLHFHGLIGGFRQVRLRFWEGYGTI